MKKTRFAFVIAAIAAVFATASCNKNEVPEVAQGGTTINAQMPEDDADPSKVYFKPFDEKQTNLISLAWDRTPGAEVIRAWCNSGGHWTSQSSTSCEVDEKNDKFAVFTIDLPAVASGSRDYYLTSPNGSSNLASNNEAIIRFKDVYYERQTSATNGPQSTTIFMISTHKGYTETPKTLNAQFKVIQAFGRMTVTNCPVTAIKEIQIAFPEKEYVTGFLDYNVNTDECVLTKRNDSKNYITIDPQYISGINKTSFVVWFAIPPMTLAQGEKLKFTIVPTEGQKYVKEVTLPKKLEFSRGTATGFTLEMAGVKPQEKEKVLIFDFSTNSGNPTLPEKWPQGTTHISESTVKFKADDNNEYEFLNGGGVIYNSGKKLNTLYNCGGTADNGYFGLPVVDGYKLTSIVIDRTGNLDADVYIEIIDDKPSSPTMNSLTGKHKCTRVAVLPAIELIGTTAGKMYYMHSLEGTYVPFRKLTLTYEAE